MTLRFYFCILLNVRTGKNNRRALSSAGRAPALQAGGHRFDPYSAHHLKWPGSSVGLECQPVTLEVEGSSPFRVAIFNLKYIVWELGRIRYPQAQIAQLVEQWTENPRVAGSIPALGTKMRV